MLSPRPSTPARAAAARANGAKSRGPVTVRGKAVSALNNLRHGLRAQDPLAIAHRAIDPEQYAQTLATFQDLYRPATPLEESLVAQLAYAYLLEQSLRRLEGQIVSNKMSRFQSEHPDAGGIQAMAMAFESLADNSCCLQFFLRLTQRCSRNFYRIIDQIEQLQLFRRNNAERSGAIHASHFNQTAFAPRKMNVQTPELTENTSLLATVRAQQFIPAPRPQKLEMNVQTAEPAENKQNPFRSAARVTAPQAPATPDSGPLPLCPPSIIELSTRTHAREAAAAASGAA